jgi:hypothetical protein
MRAIGTSQHLRWKLACSQQPLQPGEVVRQVAGSITVSWLTKINISSTGRDIFAIRKDSVTWLSDRS